MAKPYTRFERTSSKHLEVIQSRNVKKRWGQTQTQTHTTPTRGRIIVADGIYSVGDKNLKVRSPTELIMDPFEEGEVLRVKVV